MTHSIDAPPPTATGMGTGTATDTKELAKDEAQNVKDTAVQAGSQVAATATDQAKQVAQETQRQAKDLLDQGRSQVKDQVVTQQQKAGEGLSAIAQELRALADGTSEGAPGPARDLLQQASGMVESFAGKLQNREPAELLEEVRSFARRKPGMFLLGAAAAGILAGRLTSGVKAAHSDSGTSGSANGFQGGGNYVDPAPAYRAPTATPAPVSGHGVSPGTGAPLPPPPYGTVPPVDAIVPPATPAGWDDPARSGGVG
jgi:hypothetical protein